MERRAGKFWAIIRQIIQPGAPDRLLQQITRTGGGLSTHKEFHLSPFLWQGVLNACDGSRPDGRFNARTMTKRKYQRLVCLIRLGPPGPPAAWLVALPLFSGNRGHGEACHLASHPSSGIFYEIVQATRGASNLGPTRPEVVIPLNSHEIFRAIVPPVKTYFFQKLSMFRSPRSILSGTRLFRYTFGPRNLGFAQAEYVIGIDPPALCIRECVQGGAGSCAVTLRSQSSQGDRATKRASCSIPSPASSEKICLIPVHGGYNSAQCARLQPEPPLLHQRLHKQIVMVKRVRSCKLIFFIVIPPFRFWWMSEPKWRGEGERQRGSSFSYLEPRANLARSCLVRKKKRPTAKTQSSANDI